MYDIFHSGGTRISMWEGLGSWKCALFLSRVGSQAICFYLEYMLIWRGSGEVDEFELEAKVHFWCQHGTRS